MILLLVLLFEDVVEPRRTSLILLLISPRVVIVGRPLIVAGTVVVNRATWPAHFVLFWRFLALSDGISVLSGDFVVYFSQEHSPITLFL